MQSRKFAPAVAASIFLLTPAIASADYSHVVTPGETLTSVAATDGLSVSALATANGMSPGSTLVAGTVLQIPPQSGSIAAPTTNGQTAGTSSPGPYVVRPGDTLTSIAQRAGTTVSQLAAANGLSPNGVLVAGTKLNLSGGGAVSSDADNDGDNDAGASSSAGVTTSAGSYVVRPGDTLTSIAQRAGTTVAQLAAANGLNPRGLLVSGRALSVPQGSAASTATGIAQSVSGTTSSGGPYPTPETVSGSEIASIAGANGVPSSLAQAIGWQESGWNNSEVSSIGAVGVMQIVPSTWQWIQQNMASNSLAPASAADNVRGGVLLLHSLLSLTGSDSMAAAGYYQGLASVRAHGLYPDTQKYVNSVMALQQHFGGG
jgi:LysM repeat protein